MQSTGYKLGPGSEFGFKNLLPLFHLPRPSLVLLTALFGIPLQWTIYPPVHVIEHGIG